MDQFKCPVCNSPMVERTNRTSGEKFLGCSRYPGCRGSRNIDGSTGFDERDSDEDNARAEAGGFDIYDFCD